MTDSEIFGTFLSLRKEVEQSTALLEITKKMIIDTLKKQNVEKCIYKNATFQLIKTHTYKFTDTAELIDAEAKCAELDAAIAVIKKQIKKIKNDAIKGSNAEIISTAFSLRVCEFENSSESE